MASSNLPKLKRDRKKFRRATYKLPDSPYRRAMLEAFKAFDKWERTDKRPARFGRKYPQQKPAKRRKAA